MNPYFQFKRFTVYQDACAMKVSTDACAFGAWAGKRVPASSKRILDIGTGTGLLSLMLAQATEEQNSNITAIELDPAAAKQAAKNVADSPWSNRIQVVQGDIRQFSVVEKFDGIICNPPFFKNDLKPSAENYLQAHHEHSLTAAQLLERASDLASSDAWIAIMIPPNRLKDYDRLTDQFHWKIEENTTLKHSLKHASLRQFLWLKRAAISEGTATENLIAIYQQEEKYSVDFHELVRAFYLYMA